jgi:hypothetical protein
MTGAGVGGGVAGGGDALGAGVGVAAGAWAAAAAKSMAMARAASWKRAIVVDAMRPSELVRVVKRRRRFSWRVCVL